MESEGGIKVITVHLQGKGDVCIKFHDNPSNSCQDISLEGRKMGKKRKSKGITNLRGIHYLGTRPVQNVMK